MTRLNLLILLLYTLGLSLGQALFKVAADRAKSSVQHDFWVALLSTGYFYVSILLYGLLTLVWFWLLARIPLSRAYPFVALAFVFTPAFAVFFFGESVNGWYALGLAMILGGLALLVLKAA